MRSPCGRSYCGSAQLPACTGDYRLLKRGIHVLVEKPMALTVAECDATIETAAETRGTLAAGLMRRFYRAGHVARSLVQKGVLGQILSFDFREGRVFNCPWPRTFSFGKRLLAEGF